MSGEEEDSGIGVVYQFLGGLAIVGMVVLAILQSYFGRVIGKFEIGVYVLLLITALSLLRPKWFRSVIEYVADKLPFVRFTKDGG